MAHRKLRQRNEDRQCRPPSGTSLCLGTARWRMQAVWWLVWPKLFGPGARMRSSKDGPPAVTRACCLRAASQWRLAVVCILSKVVGKVLRSSAALTAVICFGLSASEEWGFAYILRSSSKLVSACNLTLPVLAACSCACSYAPSPRASQDNANEYEGYERPA